MGACAGAQQQLRGLLASPAPTPRPPRESGAERSRKGWAQGAAAVSLTSSGGKASLPSGECGRGGGQ